MVVENDAGRRIGLQHHMVMLALPGAVRRGVVDIIAQPPLLAFRINAHAARHAQMDHQGLAAVELGQEIFGAAGEAFAPSGPASRSAKRGGKGMRRSLAPGLRAE